MTKTNQKIINQEDIKMAKYIVEAPEPKRGQKVSQEAFVKMGDSLRSSKTLCLIKNQHCHPPW